MTASNRLEKGGASALPKEGTREIVLFLGKLSVTAGLKPRPSRRPRQEGFVLIILMIALTVMLVSLAAALPSIYQEGQREREEELIFRGNEYARAIYLFQRQFHRYPKSVDELLRTNNIRFLRRDYPDPMSRKGKWRFIHVGPGGVLLDSKTQAPPPSPLGQGKQSSETDEHKPKPPTSCDEKKKAESSAFFGDTNQMPGALIAGVASCSERDSIRVWNSHTKYDEWEFLGVGFNPVGVPTGQPQRPQRPGGAGQAPGRGRQGSQFPNLPPLTDQPLSKAPPSEP